MKEQFWTLPEFAAIGAGVFAGLTILWWAVTWFQLVPPLFLPSRSAVLSRLSELWTSGKLVNDTLISVYRITVGFLISTAFALPIGILIGSYRVWEAAIEPLVDFIRYMPVVGV